MIRQTIMAIILILLVAGCSAPADSASPEEKAPPAVTINYDFYLTDPGPDDCRPQSTYEVHLPDGSTEVVAIPSLCQTAYVDHGDPPEESSHTNISQPEFHENYSLEK